MQRNQIKRKSDVEFHSDGYRDGHAALNVKTYASAFDAKLPLGLGGMSRDGGPIEWSYSDPRFNREWIEAHVSERQHTQARDWALECGWDMAKEYATEVFGAGFGVYSEGRSGGWMLVSDRGRAAFDRDEVEAWDAIDLGRWRKFASWIDAIVNDLPYQIAMDLYTNEFEPWAEAEEEAAKLQERASISDDAVRTVAA